MDMERGGVKKTEGRGWSELRICTGKPERRERKDRDEQDRMMRTAAAATAAAMHASTLGWETADERTTLRKTEP